MLLRQFERTSPVPPSLCPRTRRTIDETSSRRANPRARKFGRSPHTVITNYAGLYRYRLGDVVQVVEFYGQAPAIEFLYRRGTQLDVTGEKTSEEHVAAAVSQPRERHPELELEDYTTAAEVGTSPPRYVVYVERDAARTTGQHRRTARPDDDERRRRERRTYPPLKQD